MKYSFGSERSITVKKNQYEYFFYQTNRIPKREPLISFRENGNSICTNAPAILRAWIEQKHIIEVAICRTRDHEENCLKVNAFRDRFSTSRGHVHKIGMSVIGQQVSTMRLS